jgi:hypothetical protein
MIWSENLIAREYFITSRQSVRKLDNILLHINGTENFVIIVVPFPTNNAEVLIVRCSD